MRTIFLLLVLIFISITTYSRKTLDYIELINSLKNENQLILEKLNSFKEEDCWIKISNHSIFGSCCILLKIPGQEQRKEFDLYAEYSLHLIKYTDGVSKDIVAKEQASRIMNYYIEITCSYNNEMKELINLYELADNDDAIKKIKKIVLFSIK